MGPTPGPTPEATPGPMAGSTPGPTTASTPGSTTGSTPGPTSGPTLMTLLRGMLLSNSRPCSWRNTLTQSWSHFLPCSWSNNWPHTTMNSRTNTRSNNWLHIRPQDPLQAPCLVPQTLLEAQQQHLLLGTIPVPHLDLPLAQHYANTGSHAWRHQLRPHQVPHQNQHLDLPLAPHTRPDNRHCTQPHSWTNLWLEISTHSWRQCRPGPGLTPEGIPGPTLVYNSSDGH